MANPFLKVPMILENMDKEQKEVEKRIRPAEIADYYPGLHEGTIVVLKHGSSFFCPMDTNAFDNVLIEYYKFTKKNPTMFGVVQMTAEKTKLHATD